MLDVYWCTHCTLVQLGTIVAPTKLFNHYQHLSRASQSNIRHLADVAKLLKKRFQITKQTKILEVGSNDGTMLAQFLNVTSHVLGVDPAENLVSHARTQGVEQIAAFLTEVVAHTILKTHGAHDVVLAFNVVAHTPKVKNLLRAIRLLLAPRGTFVMEAVYAFSTILKGEFDTVYHEHVYCFSLTALVPLFAQAGLTIVDVEEIPTQGGSLRVYAQRSDNKPNVEQTVKTLLAKEVARGVRLAKTYQEVGQFVTRFKRTLKQKVIALKRKHGRVIGLGASARGVVILNACGIGSDLLEAVIDDTPLKQKRLVPGAHMPVISWDEIAGQSVTAFLLLSWNYQTDMLSKLRKQVSAGKVLIPFPKIRTIDL